MGHGLFSSKGFWIFSLVWITVQFTACGGRGGTPAGGTSITKTESAGAQQPVVPTMPPAQFTAVAQQSITDTTAVTLVTTPTPVTQADASTLTRGATIYANRKCGDCHGAQGGGVADKGSALVGTALTYQEFEDILRTGGKGSLGPNHLYGASAISPGGMDALYAWIKSLPAQ